MSPQRLGEVEQHRRRRLVLRSSLRVALVWIVLFGTYYVLPVQNLYGDTAIVRLGGSGLVFIGVLAWQIRAIMRAELPELRALEAGGVAVALFLVLFSTVYLTLAHASAADFSEPLDHTEALYFTITVLSTVGFGDITPKTDFARIAVSIQMLLDLVLLGTLVRLLVRAARTGLDRTPPDSSQGPGVSSLDGPG